MSFDILAAFFPIDKRLAIIAAVIAGVLFVIVVRRKSPPKCPRCQQINREHAVFCAQCGTQLRKS